MAFQVYSPEMREEVMEQFFEESLYNFMSLNIQSSVYEHYGIYEADIWDEAKLIARKSLSSRNPLAKMEYYIRQLNVTLSNGVENSRGRIIGDSCFGIPDTVAKTVINAIEECVLSILAYTNSFDPRPLLPDSFFDYYRSTHFDMFCKVHQEITNDGITFDYDYVSNQPLIAPLPSAEVKAEEPAVQPEAVEESESVAIYYGKEGQKKVHHTNAKEISEYVMKNYDFYHLTRDEFLDILSYATGIRKSTFLNYFRTNPKAD